MGIKANAEGGEVHSTEEIKADCVMQQRCNGKVTFIGRLSADFNQQHVNMWSHLSSRLKLFYIEGHKEANTEGTLNTVYRDYRTKKFNLNVMKWKN